MAYFDNAATSFSKPETVYQRMDQFNRNTSGSFGRGNYGITGHVRGLTEETRSNIQRLLQCASKQVVFEPTATISLNITIQGVIEKGVRTVYISPFEHNAVTRTLHHYVKAGKIKVLQLAVQKDYKYDLQRIQYQFENDTPDFVIVSHASNVIGLVAPVGQICEMAKQFNAVTLVDMAQTAGLIDCNIGSEIFDFAVFAGHKTLLGPTGISGFVMKPDFPLPAVMFGGTGFESANQDMPLSLPERFEFGTMNGVGVAGLHASTKWILERGIDYIYSKESENRKRLIELLSSYDFVTIVGNHSGNQYVGIVSCLMDGVSSDTAGQLFAERNVAVRTGLHCAPLAHQQLGTYPAGTIRFSVSCLTDDEDFTTLEAALDDIYDNL